VLLVVGEGGLQVGGWSWWTSMLSDECATPGVQLSGLVSVCGRCRWSLESVSIGRWSRCFFLFIGGGLRWLGLGGAAAPVHPLVPCRSSCSSSSD
jgi:hypothetical protein